MYLMKFFFLQIEMELDSQFFCASCGELPVDGFQMTICCKEMICVFCLETFAEDGINRCRKLGFLKQNN